MQKVVGSSPIIRSRVPAKARVVLHIGNDEQNFVPSGLDYRARFPQACLEPERISVHRARLRIFAGGSHVGVSPSLTRARGAQCVSCSLKFILVLVAEIVLET
jgi:hypothetical protein